MYTIKVTDENGEYIPAANVFDAETGKYLGAVYEEGLVVNVPRVKVTYIGFQPQEVTLKEGLNTIAMQPAIVELGTAEVVTYSTYRYAWLFIIAALIIMYKISR